MPSVPFKPVFYVGLMRKDTLPLRINRAHPGVRSGHDGGHGRPVSRTAGSRSHSQRHDRPRPRRLARAGRQLSLGRTSEVRNRNCCAAPTAFCPSAALPEVGSYVARRLPASRSSWCAPATARCGPSATPVGIAACKWRAARVARVLSPAAITAGPTISKAGCAISHGGASWLRQGDSSAGAGRGSRALRPGRSSRKTKRGRATTPFDGLSKLIAPDQRLFATAERDFDVNWKIFLESFIEAIIKSTHPEFPALRLRQPERHRPVWPPQPRHVSVPAHQKLAKVPPAAATDRRPC